MTPSNDIVLISKVLPFCIYIQSVPLWYILCIIEGSIIKVKNCYTKILSESYLLNYKQL